MSERKIYKPKPISGFPEWLPEVRRVEQQWMDHIRRVFESYGYCSIETPSVEELDVLNAKGGDGGADVDKEVYVIERLHKKSELAEALAGKAERLALHFDQTVPLARYVAQHFNDLVFPFKRYQMQKVWRGERPQAGRFREFYQCDIDVINVDNLPLHFDAEMPAIMWEILSSLPGMENEKIQIRVSNRKVLFGFLKSLGVTNQNDIDIITRTYDKRDKIGHAEFVKAMTAAFQDDKKMLHIVGCMGNFVAAADKVREYQTNITFEQHAEVILALTAEDSPSGIDPLLKEGLDELNFVIKQLAHLPPHAVVADLSIVRGLDYYTGTVYETVFVDDPGYGSICSGGRYDDLAGNYINKHLPGVGISIGFSRLFDRLRQQNKLNASRISPADVLVVVPSEERRALAAQVAHNIRARGINAEQYHAPQKIGKQISYAEKKGIPYVWFPPFEDGKPHEVKNLITGEQSQADPETWTPHE